MRSSGGSAEGLVSSSLTKLDDILTYTLSSGYSSLPHFLADIDKGWLVNIRKALHLCAVGSFDRFNAFSLLVQAVMIPLRHLCYLFLTKDDMLLLSRMV